MITAGIIEDEETNILLIKMLLEKHNLQVRVVGEAKSVDTAVSMVLRQKPDMLFMDVHIIGGSAFDVLLKLPKKKPEIIFITAYDQYAIAAIKHNAADYLLKPFDTADFIEGVRKAVVRIHKEQVAQEKTLLRSIPITTGNTTEMVRFDDIIYLEADGAYTQIITKKGKIISSRNMGEYEEQLPGELFFRTHHSFIVNLFFISSFETSRSGIVQLQSGESIPVSQRRLTDFKKRIQGQNLVVKD